MLLRRCYLLLVSLVWSSMAIAAEPGKLSVAAEDSEFWPAAGLICAALVCILALAFYVRQQNKNNTLIMAKMFGTILDGWLWTLLVDIEDLMETLEVEFSPGMESRVLFAIEPTFREEMFDLLKRNGIGSRNRKKLEQGFSCLCAVVDEMRQFSDSFKTTGILPSASDRQGWLAKLRKSDVAFDTVRHRVYL